MFDRPFERLLMAAVSLAFVGQVVFVNAGISLRSGSGSPEGAVTAPVGSIYLRSNGGAGTTLYVKESGSSNTGWVAVSPAGSGAAITALTGNVTATGPGSVAATIANDAVTYAKMQNVSATDRILCRDTSGAGDVEECDAAAVIAMIGALTASSSSTLTNKTIDAEGTGNVITIPSIFVFNPGACQDATGSLAFSLPASGLAPTADCVAGTNVRFGVAGFNDDGAERQVQGHFTLPADWTGAIDLLGKWRSADTSGSVVWQIATICVADAETSDPAFNTAQAITDAAKGTTLQQNDFSQTTLTVTGCAAGEEFYFKFFRDSDHASDDLATATDGIAQLISLRFVVRRAM